MSHREEWFRSADWDDAARSEFESRLARARADNRVQYRRIKAVSLFGTADPRRAVAARELLEQNIAADSDDFEKVIALVLLAKQERAEGRLQDAQVRLRLALAIAGPDGGGTSGEEEIELAEILLEQGGPKRVAEAKALLDRRAQEMPFFVRSRYRLCVALVRTYLALGDEPSAVPWAGAALDLAAVENSGLASRPALGLVEADSEALSWLRSVASDRSADFSR